MGKQLLQIPKADTHKHVPQTVLALRGSHGVGIEAAMGCDRIRPWTRPLILLLFTELGDAYLKITS